MRRIEGLPILTAAEMRAAEERAIAAGSSVTELMERAGAGVAEAVRRLAAGAPVLVLCGPGNNGGDGYVAARLLRADGLDVRVAALGEPKTGAAEAARAAWNSPITSIEAAGDAPIVVDALFGSGLSRPFNGLSRDMPRLCAAARLRVAIDLPSGVDTDTGAVLGTPLAADLTLALGAVKPAHLLQPSARFCGEVRLLDIGIEAVSPVQTQARPNLAPPGPDDHKYTRGLVAIIGGAMPGAAVLSAEAAMRSGAGYALLLADDRPATLAHAVVQKPWSKEALDDTRIAAVLIGPGLGRDKTAALLLDAALASDHPLIIDGDALHLVADGRLDALRARGNAILTPHAGEFTALFEEAEGGKIAAAIDAAQRSNSVVVFKGPDTVIASPDGMARVALPSNPWLSTAGTGDVLAGAIAGLVKGRSLLDAADAGVWLHAEAARHLGAAFIADDLARALSPARAAL